MSPLASASGAASVTTPSAQPVLTPSPILPAVSGNTSTPQLTTAPPAATLEKDGYTFKIDGQSISLTPSQLELTVSKSGGESPRDFSIKDFQPSQGIKRELRFSGGGFMKADRSAIFIDNTTRPGTVQNYGLQFVFSDDIKKETYTLSSGFGKGFSEASIKVENDKVIAKFKGKPRKLSNIGGENQPEVYVDLELEINLPKASCQQYMDRIKKQGDLVTVTYSHH